MLTLGLLVSLDPAQSGAVELRLRAHPSMTVGEVADRWLPVAVEAEDDSVCRDFHEWIGALPGVAFVDVVHVNFEEPPADSTSPLSP